MRRGPQDFEIPDDVEMFDAETMKELVELGHKLGADARSWRNEALTPRAPSSLD
jgi:hypothetical protein